jgi:hypothetical protein
MKRGKRRMRIKKKKGPWNANQNDPEFLLEAVVVR